MHQGPTIGSGASRTSLEHVLGSFESDNYNGSTPANGGETVSTLSVEALEASRGLRGPVNKPEKPISAEDNFALAA